MTEVVSDPPESGNETIYLVSTSGHPNYGDELIAAAWLRVLAATRPTATVWLDCANPGLACHLFEGLHPGLRVTNNLWRLMRETVPLGLREADQHVERVITQLGSPHYDLGLAHAREATTIHLVGGGHLNAVWPHHLQLFRAAQRLRDFSGARLVATGLGLMPAVDPAELRATFSEFDHATVRDQPSAEVSGLECIADDALLDVHRSAGYRDGAYAAAPRTGDVWVCLQSDATDSATFEAALAAVREALTGPLSGRTVRYLEAIPGDDGVAFDRLRDLVPEENFMPFVQLWHEGFPGQAGQTWLTSRYHFHMLAAACGAEGTALEVSSDYYRVKHQSLRELGTGWSVTPQGSRSITMPSGNRRFRSVAAALHEAKRSEAERLYPAPRIRTEPIQQPPARPGPRALVVSRLLR